MGLVKQEYFDKLREQALEKHRAALNLAFNKAKEAAKLLECDLNVQIARPPTSNYQIFNAHLTQEYQRLEELNKVAKEAEELTKPEVYMVHPDFNWWVHHYERELYAPTADDYITEEDEIEVSHETSPDVEPIEVVE